MGAATSDQETDHRIVDGHHQSCVDPRVTLEGLVLGQPSGTAPLIGQADSSGRVDGPADFGVGHRGRPHHRFDAHFVMTE